MSNREQDMTDPPLAGPSGRLTAHFIREAFVQYRGRPRKLGDSITTPRQAVDFARRVVNDHAREHALALYLDSLKRPIAYAVVAVGTAESVELHPREVFQTAIHAGASWVTVLHNHPCGDPEPSLRDHLVAERLVQAGELLGVHIEDFIVWTHHSSEYDSSRETDPKLFRWQRARTLGDLAL